ncbi:hypothetical protein ACUOA8_54260, partial [Escherichia sp. SS-MK2]
DAEPGKFNVFIGTDSARVDNGGVSLSGRIQLQNQINT